MFSLLSLPLPLLNFEHFMLSKYFVVTQESIVIPLFIWACNVCDVLCIITLVMTHRNDLGYD
jgi:hypothetical protein